MQQRQSQNVQGFDHQQDNNPLLKNYGHMIVLCMKNGKPIFMLGPHWYIFIISFIISFSLLVFMMVSIHSQLTLFWFILLTLFISLYGLAYINIGLSNPGIASSQDQPPQYIKADPRYCQECKIIKQGRINHCLDCGVCIYGYDHHCPWIGKCVGSNNLSAFYFFLIMTFGTMIMCFIGVLVSNVGSKRNLTIK